MGLVCAGAGFEAGVIWTYYFHHITLDGGTATVLAALIALGGVVWGAQFAATIKDDPFTDFVVGGAREVWLEATRLATLCEATPGSEPAAYVQLLRWQAESVAYHAGNLEQKAPQLRILNYRAHVEVDTMCKVFKLEIVTLENEVAVLNRRPTSRVIDIARKKLRRTAGTLTANCVNVCAAIDHRAKFDYVPTIEEVVVEIRRRAGAR